MKILVTGCAGFIGSHTTDRLLAEGHSVRGVDCFTDNYDPALKRANVAALDRAGFELVEEDLATVDVIKLLEGVDRVLHLAGQPGVRQSWARGFGLYVQRNIEVTQGLLEAARTVGVERFAAASSSSVYGDAETFPTPESAVPRPVSPYGVTKLAAEHLCTLYGTNFGVPTVSLRYFTVYGPRQRADMAISRMINAALRGEAFPLYGDGTASRSFTYIDDVVDANLAALFGDVPAGSVCNIADRETTSISELIRMVESATGLPLTVDRHPSAPGDAQRTGGAIELAQQLLGWSPRTSLAEGVAAQVDWARRHLDTHRPLQA